MDTKWKNMIRQGKDYLEKRKDYVSGVLLAAGGIGLFFNVIMYRRDHPTEEAVMFSILGDLFLGAGLAILLGKELRYRYREWKPESEAYYQEWKKIEKRWRIRLLQFLIGGLLVSAWYLSFLMGGGRWGGYGGGWYVNYASGYMLIISVLIQYVVCRTVSDAFFRGRLDELMEKMEEIDQKRLERALEIEKKSRETVSRSDQLRVDLITNVSHDLKTPLTSMVGYIELIRKEELSDVVRDYVDVISARADKLKEMIGSLFSLAKASSGNVDLHIEVFELNRLMEQIFADMDDRIKDSGLKFVTQYTEEDTHINSDNTYFYRICQNLMENALKYSAKGTRVFVRTYRKKVEEESLTSAGERLCLEITNTAGYFMDFTKEDIVERFARGDKARTGDGNGLGLAIVSTYAKALGGEFDIRIDCDQFKALVEMPCA